MKVFKYNLIHYMVKYWERGNVHTEFFKSEEEALKYIEDNWTLNWSDYTLRQVLEAEF